MTHPATVTWYGHSNMLLTCGGVRVLVDPFFEGNRLAPDWKTIPRPDVIAVTHDHGDHLGQTVDIARATGAVVACIVELAGWVEAQGVAPDRVVGWNMGGSVRIGELGLAMTPAFHSAERGSPVGFVLELPGGPVVYHAGDTCLFGDMALIGEHFSPDVAMLPVGGRYTMDGVQAARACALLGTPTAIPMHYGTFDVLDSSADAFVEALKTYAPDCRPLLPEPGIPLPLPGRRRAGS